MNLKELRKQQNLSQQDMANMLNISQRTYCGYEKETSEPNIDTLIKIANYYNVSLDYLVGRSFNNDIGYLTEEQRYCTQNILKLNQMNLMKATSYILGLLATQG